MQKLVDGALVDLSPEEVAARQAEVGAPPPIPRVVSMRQARLALLNAGLLANVEALIAQQPQAVQIEWQFATDVWRDRDLVKTLGATLQLPDRVIDHLFIQAAAIP